MRHSVERGAPPHSLGKHAGWRGRGGGGDARTGARAVHNGPELVGDSEIAVARRVDREASHGVARSDVPSKVRRVVVPLDVGNVCCM